MVTLADTGLEAMTGARLRKVHKLIGDSTFMLSYGDGLSDVDLGKLVKHHQQHKKFLTVTGVRPPSRFGELQVDDTNNVIGFNEKPQASGGRISGGFFVCEPKFSIILNHAKILCSRKNRFKKSCMSHE